MLSLRCSSAGQEIIKCLKRDKKRPKHFPNGCQQAKSLLAAFEIPTVTLLKTRVFWDVRLCRLARSSDVSKDYAFFIFKFKESRRKMKAE